MENEVYLDNERNTICCSLEGELDIENAIVLSKKLRKKASELGFSVFYDARKLYVTENVLPADFTAKLTTILEKLSDLLEASSHRSVKVALLYDPGKYDEYWTFYEDVAVSRGLSIKVFTNRDEAVGWLAE